MYISSGHWLSTVRVELFCSHNRPSEIRYHPGFAAVSKRTVVPKMAGLLHLVLLVMVWVNVVDSIKEGFSFKLLKECKYSAVGDVLTTAMLTVIIDTPDRSASVKAECLNNSTHRFSTMDHITYTLPVYYDEKLAGDNCIFRNVSRYLYTLTLKMAYGSPGSYVQQYEEQHTLSCNMDYGTGNASEVEVGEGFIAPQEIQDNVGIKHENVTMRIIDIFGHDLNANSIAIGRYIKLKAMTYGEPNGLLASSCSAVGDNGLSYAFLRGGCGDGLVFNRQSGFDTLFTESESEPFQFFGIDGATTVSFYCNFTICATTCHQNSCYLNSKNRGKRFASVIPDLQIMAHTGAVRWILLSEDFPPSRSINGRTPPSRSINGRTQPIEWADKDSESDEGETVFAETDPVQVLREDNATFEAATRVITFLQPEPTMDRTEFEKDFDMSRTFYSNTSVALVLKIVLAVVASLSLISLSISIYLIRNRGTFVASKLPNA